MPATFCFVALSLVSCSAEQAFDHDAVVAATTMELSEGLNTVQKSEQGNMELAIKAVPGQVPKYIILRNGKEIDSELEEREELVAGAKKTTCWECGKDENGDRHCWKVPCPVIVGPWLSTGRLPIKVQ